MTFNKTTFAILGLSAILAGFTACEGGYAQTPSTAPNPQKGSKSEPLPLSQNSDGTMTLHASAHLVILDVSVWDWKGSPATGLSKDAFHLFEDGHEQTIRNVEEHSPIDPAIAREKLAAVAAKLPPNTFTNFKPFPTPPANVIVFDALTSPDFAQKDHHDLILTYLKVAPPGTPFVIFKLDTQLHLVQGLTMDQAVLRAAVEVKPKEVFTQPVQSWIQRRQIVGAAVDQLTRYLSATPGRKTMFWFTYLLGIDLSSDGTHDDPGEADLFCKWTDSLQQNRIDVYRLGSDPPGVGAGLGCRPGRKAGDIAAAVDFASHFYTLSYTPTNANWDGHYRKLKVDVNGKGTPWQGIKLDYREGYFGRSDDGSVRNSVVSTALAGSAPSLALQQAMGLGAPTPDDVVFEATVKSDAEIVKDVTGDPVPPGNFLNESLRAQGYRVYSVHYAVRANQLRLIASPDQTAYAEKLEAVTVVYDSLGHALNSKRSVVSVSFDSPDDPHLQTATVTDDLTTQVPAKGDYFLRIGVHDLATDKVGALEIPASSIKSGPDAVPMGEPGK